METQEPPGEETINAGGAAELIALMKAKEQAVKGEESFDDIIRSRKRKSNPSNWACTKSKIAKNMGLEHKAYQKQEGKWVLVDRPS